MAEFIGLAEIVEGKKCRVITRRQEYRRGLHNDPITNKVMVLYELDRNCSVEVTEELTMSDEEKKLRDEIGVHYQKGDKLIADAISLYVNTKRKSLKFEVTVMSGRHEASVVNTNIRTIGKIKTPLQNLNKILGYSPNSDKIKIGKREQ